MELINPVRAEEATSNLEFPAEICEELNPELAVVHVVQPHLLLGVLTHQVPVLVPVPPVAPPLVPVPPGVPHPHQTHPLLPPGPRSVDPVEASDGVGVTLAVSQLTVNITLELQGIKIFSYWGGGGGRDNFQQLVIHYWVNDLNISISPPTCTSPFLSAWREFLQSPFLEQVMKACNDMTSLCLCWLIYIVSPPERRRIF